VDQPHLEPEPHVDLCPVVLVRLPQQAEKPAEGFDDRGDPLFAHSFRWRLGQAEPSLRRLLDRGRLAGPASHERRISPGIEGGPTAGDAALHHATAQAAPQEAAAMALRWLIR
jgi:hypothetical protein